MRALFFNALNDSVMTATASSSNYPIESVIHPFMKKRWQCLINNSVITCVFNSVKDINCIWYSYHTLNSLSFELFNESNILLYSHTETNIEDIGVTYFPKISGVKKIVINVSSLGVLRIGTLWAGEYKQLSKSPDGSWNDFLSNYKMPFDDNTTVSKSSDYQFLQLYIEPGRDFQFSWTQMNDTQRLFIEDVYYRKSIGSPWFVDIFHLNHAKQVPKYVVFKDRPDIVKDGRTFNITLNFKEAR